MSFSNFDKNMDIHLYNFDLEDSNHWLWKFLVTTILNRFSSINFYIRNDKSQNISKKLKKYKIDNIEVLKEEISYKKCGLIKMLWLLVRVLRVVKVLLMPAWTHQPPPSSASAQTPAHGSGAARQIRIGLHVIYELIHLFHTEGHQRSTANLRHSKFHIYTRRK